jgi:hypothetical protein
MFSLPGPGPDDSKSILGHLTEAERLVDNISVTIEIRPNTTHGSASAENIKPLEFLGPITGFVCGDVAPMDDSVHYSEGVVKGSQSESIRIGWELQCGSCHSRISNRPLSPRREIPFPLGPLMDMQRGKQYCANPMMLMFSWRILRIRSQRKGTSSGQ